MAKNLRTDPTRTTLLRKAFMADMKRRFKKLSQAIQKLVVDEDCFGLKNVPHLKFNAQIWHFKTDAQKVQSFRDWLNDQVNAGILSPLDGEPGKPWTAQYVENAYRKGALRAYTDLRASELAQDPSIFKGGQAEFLRTAMKGPIPVKKIEMLYTRAYTDLKGVTDAMGAQMSRIITTGFTMGHGPAKIARELRDNVSRMTKSRAMTIARTEVVAAHAEGQLDAFEKLGVQEVGVMAEWLTAGDDRVCSLCGELEGVVMSTKEAHELIPRHPNCRCCWIPANVGESKTGQMWKRDKNDAVVRSLDLEKNPTWAGRLRVKKAAVKRVAKAKADKIKEAAKASVPKVKKVKKYKPFKKKAVKTKVSTTKADKSSVDIREQMKTSEIKMIKPLGGGVNDSVIAKNGIKGVFKSKSGEYRDLRRGIKTGTYYKREAAAYEVDQIMELDFVPPTVVRKVKGKVGSYQKFAESAEVPSYISFPSVPGQSEASTYAGSYLIDKDRVAVFDFIIGNRDRHQGNIMLKVIKKGGKVTKIGKQMVGIDNGLSFTPMDHFYLREAMHVRSYALKRIIGLSANKKVPVPPKLLKKVGKLIDKEKEVRKTLKPYLATDEIDGMMARAKWMVKEKRYPINGDVITKVGKMDLKAYITD